MKNKTLNILSSLIIMMICNICLAQNKTKSASESENLNFIQNTLVKDTVIDKFVGTWIYNENNTLFKLVLTKELTTLGGKNSTLKVELLNGGYLLIKNSKEIMNTLEKKPLWGSSDGNKFVATLSIRNKKTDSHTNIDIYYLDKNTIMLKQSLKKGEGNKYENEFGFPLNIKLTRGK